MLLTQIWFTFKLRKGKRGKREEDARNECGEAEQVVGSGLVSSCLEIEMIFKTPMLMMAGHIVYYSCKYNSSLLGVYSGVSSCRFDIKHDAYAKV